MSTILLRLRRERIRRTSPILFIEYVMLYNTVRRVINCYFVLLQYLYYTEFFLNKEQMNETEMSPHF